MSGRSFIMSFLLIAVSTYKPTILVEIYSNEQVNGLQKANDIINVIKSAIDNNIIKKQTSQVASSASYVINDYANTLIWESLGSIKYKFLIIVHA